MGFETAAKPKGKNKVAVMKEKIKIMSSVLVFLLFFPYLITIFLQGISIENEEFLESATETLSVPKSKENKENREQLISILAKEIDINSEKEAMKAQAVIVRQNYNYALAKGTEPEEGLSVQEMMTQFGENNFSVRYEELTQCMDETAGTQASFAGDMVMLPFHAVSAGKTRSAKEISEKTAFPYLVGVDSTFDIPSENYLKVVYFEKTEFLAQLEQIFTGVVFSEEDILTQLVIDGRDSASYVTSISAGGISISGEDFRKRLGLNSACFSIGEADGKIRIVTKGLGHGLGLSEWGANELAKQGKDYIEILKYYFPNIEITE